METEVIDIDIRSLEELIQTAQQPVIVEFYTPLCAPCKALTPILEEIAAQRGDTVKIVKVDASKEWSLAKSYSVMATPTLIKFIDGKQIDSIYGFRSREPLIEWIDKG